MFHPVKRELSFYDKGIATSAPHHALPGFLPDHLQGVKRGKIVGWSSDSRARMRDFLLKHAPGVGRSLYAVTLTIPGTVPPSETEKAFLWKSISKKFRNSDAGIVWRHELQRRGASHWHCLAAVPSPFNGVNFPEDMPFEDWLRFSWIRTLDQLPPSQQVFKSGDIETCRRGNMEGAFAHCCDVQADRGGVKWLQYLLDHCTKRKQAQVALSGRAWGVINRGAFRELESVPASLAFPEWVAFFRVLRRWSRPTIKAECVFGSRRGFKTRRGMRGASVWFGDVAAFRRAVDWAAVNPAALRPASRPLLLVAP